MKIPRWIEKISRLGLSFIFLLAGGSKLRNRTLTLQSLREFGVPARVVGQASVALPAFELGIAGSLILRSTAVTGSSLAAMSLVTFTSAMALKLLRGEKPNCGCFGGSAEDSIGIKSLARNAVLIAMTVPSVSGARVFQSCRANNWQFAKDRRKWIVPGTLMIHSILIALTLKRFGEIRNLLEGGNTGLSKGDRAPDFHAPDIRGDRTKMTSLEDVMRFGETVLVFTTPTCRYCAELYPVLADDSGQRSSLLVMQSLHEEATEALVQYPELDGIIDSDGSIAEAYGIQGFPTAIRVGSDGVIQEKGKVGAPAIKKLLRAR